jgi:hypothetical protein
MAQCGQQALGGVKCVIGNCDIISGGRQGNTGAQVQYAACTAGTGNYIGDCMSQMSSAPLQSGAGGYSIAPNPNTALGGLFAAQQAQLCRLLPSLTTGANAAGIGSGNFGSLRGCMAVNTAKANALASLQAQQMCAALKNQATGVNAATEQSNVTNQGINAAMNVGQEQMVSPFSALANASSIINATRPGATVSTIQTPSTLNQLGGAGSLIQGGVTGACNLLKQLGVTGGLSGLIKGSGSGALNCGCLVKCKCTGYCKSSCGNLIICKNDKSGCYSGCQYYNCCSSGSIVCYPSNYCSFAGWSC